jgi:O-methyltransferase involved in polyketide biosynthesis
MPRRPSASDPAPAAAAAPAADPTAGLYRDLEAAVLRALLGQLARAEDAGEALPAATLSTAVSLLRAGQVPAASTAAARTAGDAEPDWFGQLPDGLREQLRARLGLS